MFEIFTNPQHSNILSAAENATWKAVRQAAVSALTMNNLRWVILVRGVRTVRDGSTWCGVCILLLCCMSPQLIAAVVCRSSRLLFLLLMDSASALSSSMLMDPAGCMYWLYQTTHPSSWLHPLPL
jgi:hypothetical protein